MGNLMKEFAVSTIIRLSPLRTVLVGVFLGMALCSPLALSADEKPAAKPLDVKSTFRNICGFCHENYGRKAAKGPQLMDSARSDEFLFNRIKSGMPGRMAAFGSAFTDDQIRQIVKFIRNLKPDQEPDNP